MTGRAPARFFASILGPALVTAAGVAVLAAAPRQDPQRPGFRATGEYVAVYATVLDKTTGRLVPNLGKEAFELLDNGKKQEITVFSNEIQPITVVVMLDRSGSMMPFADVVRAGAEKFVLKLLPDDRARVGDFSHQVQILPDAFTGDPKQLVWNLRTNLQTARNGPSPVWWAVERSMTALDGETGRRRVVLLFSDGHDDPSYGQMRVTFKELQRRVLDDEIMVYAIGVPARIPSAYNQPFSGNVLGPGLQGAMKFEPPDPDLRKIAEESGGGYFELTSNEDLDATFERVADELHRQYLLGFSPARLDTRTHDIEVRVKDRDVKVRARKNYRAAAGR